MQWQVITGMVIGADGVDVLGDVAALMVSRKAALGMWSGTFYGVYSGRFRDFEGTCEGWWKADGGWEWLMRSGGCRCGGGEGQWD